MIDESFARREWSPATIAAGRLLVDHAQFDRSLAEYCTYRVGGPAAVLVHIDSVELLEEVAGVIGATGAAVLVVGRGSNLLVADRGFDGVAIVLGPNFAETAVLDVTPELVTVRSGGAALLPVVARVTVREGLTGFEWAVGVPGSIGGAVKMNAGGHGSDMADSLVRVEVIDLRGGDRGWRSRDALSLGYRTSNLGPHDLVTAAELGLRPGDRATGQRRLTEIVQWRREHQPGGANAGSVFANPPGDSAGRLIDAAGLKGLRIGSAVVSEKHANFIQADPDGSADDVMAVVREIQRRVADGFGIRLQLEHHTIGFDDPRPASGDPAP